MYEQGAPCNERIPKHCLSLQAWSQGRQSPEAIDSGQGCQRQQAGLLNYAGDKRKAWKNVCPLLNEALVNSATQERDRDRAGYQILSSSQPLLARPAFRNPKLQRLVGKAGTRKMYPWWNRTWSLITLDLLKSRGTHAPMSAERMDWCLCYTIPNNLSYMTLTTGRSTRRQEWSKCYSYLQVRASRDL